MKKILLFIFLFSGFIFGQNELIRRIEFKDSLSNHYTKTQVNTLLSKKLNIADSLLYVTPTQLSAYESLLPTTPENPATKFLDGNRQWSTIAIGAGGFAGNLYFTTEASDVSGYKKISYVNEVTETELSGTLTNQEVLIRTYLYDYGLATTVIDAGVWIANYRAKVSGTQGDTQLKIEIFLRHADNSETTLWSDYSPILDNTSYATIRSESNQPAFNCLTTDRLGARIYAKITAANPITVYTIVGDGDASYFTTPLRIRHNQLRDLNGDPLFLHATNTDTARWNDKYTKIQIDSLKSIDVTYADLVTKINASTLKKGTYYKITDFATIHYFLDNQNTLNTATNTGATEPLIVLAISSNQIAKEAYSLTYPKDIIYYDWNPANWLADKSFAYSGTIISGFKGVIYYRKDMIQNVQTNYDWRNVKLRRWLLNPSTWDSGTSYSRYAVVKAADNKLYFSKVNTNLNNAYTDTTKWRCLFDVDLSLGTAYSWRSDYLPICNWMPDVDSLHLFNVPVSGYTDVLTFGAYNSGIVNISIGTNVIAFNTIINNVAFIISTTLKNITMVEEAGESTFVGASAQFLYFGRYFYNNIIADGCYDHTSDEGFFRNVIGYGFSKNHNRVDFSDNNFGRNCMNNDFGGLTQYGSWLADCKENVSLGYLVQVSFGRYFQNNLIRNRAYNLWFGDYFLSNTVRSYFRNNRGGHEVSFNDFGEYTENCIFPSSFQRATIRGAIGTGIDFTGSTLATNTTFNKEYYRDYNGNQRMRYTTAIGTQIIVNPATDALIATSVVRDTLNTLLSQKANLSGATFSGDVTVGTGASDRKFIARSTSGWRYYFASSTDDFRIYDSDDSTFIKMFYNGGGTGKYLSLRNGAIKIKQNALGFFGATPATKPSGNVLTALSNLGLITSPTLSVSDVGNTVAQWNANKLRGIDLSLGSPANGKIYVYRSDSTKWVLEDKPAGGADPDSSKWATRYWANNTFAPINLTASSIGISMLGTPTYTTAQDYINTTLSAGKISGGDLTAVDSLHISVAAGKGFIKTTNSSVGSTVSFDWTANTNLLVTAGSVNYIYIDYNSGTPIISATTTESNINRNTQIPIGACYTDGHETPHVFTDGILLSNWLTNEQRRLLEVRRAEHASGAIVSETGTRNISITDGVFYIAGTRATFSAFNSSGAGRFKYVYADGSGGWTYVSAQSQINNTNYDNGTGSLGTLTVNKYGVHWVFILTDGEIYVKYGVGDYTLAQAQAAQIPASLPTELTSFGVIAAKIIIQKSAAAFNSVISAYTTPFGTQSPSTHNDLAGLQGGTSNEYYHLTNAKYVKLDSLTARAYDLNLVTPTFISNSHTHANKAKLDSLNGSASKLNRIGNLTDGNGVLTNTSGTLSWSASSGGGCLMGTNASAVTTTSSSYVDASGYSVTLEANTTYFFSGSLYYGGSTNVTQAQFVYPDGTTAYGWVQYEDENGVGGHPMADIFTQLASIAPTTNYYEKVNFSGKLVTSSTAGDLKLQIKRTSGTGNATLSSLSSFALIKKN